AGKITKGVRQPSPPCRKSRNSRLILKTAYVANSYAKFPYMAQSQSTLRISEAQLRRRYFGTERALVILAVCTAFGAVFLLFGCLFMKAEQRSSKSGVLTMGKIIDKGRRSDTARTADGDIQWAYWVIDR